MKTIWILPHRDQGDDEDVVVDGDRCKLSEAIDVGQLPAEVTLGIPEAVLREHGTSDLIFGQFVRDRSKQLDYYVLSVPAGKDKDGRAVYLTALSIKNSTEPILDPLPTEGLNTNEQKLADEVQMRIQNRADRWSARVKDMLEAVGDNPTLTTFANTPLRHSPFSPAWTPDKKKITWISLTVVCIATVIVAVVVLRGCLGSHANEEKNVYICNDFPFPCLTLLHSLPTLL